MPNNSKRRREAKMAARLQRQSQIQGDDIDQIFLGQGAEPITDTLIQELVKNGWKENELRSMQEEGAMYSRPRNSLIFPTQSL